MDGAMERFWGMVISHTVIQTCRGARVARVLCRLSLYGGVSKDNKVKKNLLIMGNIYLAMNAGHPAAEHCAKGMIIIGAYVDDLVTLYSDEGEMRALYAEIGSQFLFTPQEPLVELGVLVLR